MRSWALALLLLAGCAASPPQAPIASTESFEAIHFATTAGNVTVILYEQAAPQTVALMKRFVAEGYYAGRGFFRVVPGHVIQVTDPTGGASDDPRRVPLEVHAQYKFSAGALGIARGADPGSGGPQFFIMDFATSHLHGNYTVWGQVVQGLDIVHRIARGPTFDFRALPSELAPLAPTDRLALQPTFITGASLDRIEVPAGMYPLDVAQNHRFGDYRHSLDWSPGSAARESTTREYTWYVRGYNDTAPPDAASVRIQVGQRQVPVVGDPEFAGIYRFTAMPGQDAVLVADGKALGTLRLGARAGA
jgi:cyclophilin family peptidyl-prolyl cis-trans isomerase